MATDRADSEGPGEEAGHEPRECMPCRGEGRVISNLGGSAELVTCPWCEGSGVRIPGIDAQQRWRERDSGTGSEPPGGREGPPEGVAGGPEETSRGDDPSAEAPAERG